jgi:hypothetical protein
MIITNEWLVITAVLVCSLFLTMVNFAMLYKQREDMNQTIDYWRSKALEAINEKREIWNEVNKEKERLKMN